MDGRSYQSRSAMPWRGYYLTAYGIAVKNGFKGTEREWLESLIGEKGDSVELRYNKEVKKLQWRHDGAEEEWKDLLEIGDIQGEVVAQTVQETEAARDEAKRYSEEAGKDASRSENAASKAAGSASKAETMAGKAAESEAAAKEYEESTRSLEKLTEASKEKAASYAKSVESDANRAEGARAGAEAAQRAIENLGVSAHSIAAGSEAKVTKSVSDNGVTLYFEIPRGEQGAVGPRGAQGIEGPEGKQGPPGESGVVTPASGWFTLAGDADGNLWAYYNDTDTPPKFNVDADGNIYYITPDAA